MSFTPPEYATPAQVKNAAHAIPTEFWDDTELTEAIQQQSVTVHNILGRDIDDTIDQVEDRQIYLTVQKYVIYAAACDVISSVDEMVEQARLYQSKYEYFRQILEKGGDTSIVTAEYDLNKGLDPDQYEPVC